MAAEISKFVTLHLPSHNANGGCERDSFMAFGAYAPPICHSRAQLLGDGPQINLAHCCMFNGVFLVFVGLLYTITGSHKVAMRSASFACCHSSGSLNKTKLQQRWESFKKSICI